MVFQGFLSAIQVQHCTAPWHSSGTRPEHSPSSSLVHLATCVVQGATSDLFASGGDEGFVTRLSAGDSLTAVEDVSDFFGSHWGFEEERFEASGEDVQRRWVTPTSGLG